MLQLKERLAAELQNIAKKASGRELALTLGIPQNKKHGDLSSNVALLLAKELKKSPQDVFGELLPELEALDLPLEQIEFAAPGFVNFFLKKSVKLQFLSNLEFAFTQNLGKTYLLEHSSPNLFKPFHIGHLLNNSYGEALSSLLEASGAKVIRLSFPSDVSPGIAKAVWAIKRFYDKNNFDIKDLEQAYVKGVREYEQNPNAKEEIDKINEILYKQIESEELEIYKKGKELSLNFFKSSVKKLGTEFDAFIFESEAEKVGKRLVMEHTPQVFEESEGAYIFKGSEKCGLFDNVFINSQGFGTYLAKDLGLLQIKFENWKFEKSITITDKEQENHFKLLLCAASLINSAWSQKSIFLHHGRLNPKGGKFSSRLGGVPLASDVLDEIAQEVQKKMQESGKGDINDAEKIALAALKYQILKVSMGKNPVWDKEKALSFEGDSGPYILYSLVRAKSVLKKAKFESALEDLPDDILQSDFARELLRFELVFSEATDELKAHTLVNYLSSLSASFNAFYAKHKILGNKYENELLLLLQRFVNILEFSLSALKIPTVEKM